MGYFGVCFSFSPGCCLDQTLVGALNLLVSHPSCCERRAHRLGTMAYRKMAGSVGGMEPPAPSFLDEFLEQIQPLPSQVKAKFAELRDLDDRANTMMSDAERAAADAVRKASTKSTGGNDPLKRAFQDVLACQGKAVDSSTRKVELAESSYQLIEETIKSLDDKLREYEAQLKKDGRWPAENNVKKEGGASNRKSTGTPLLAGPGAGSSSGLKSGGGASTGQGTPSLGVSAGSNPKSRRRDREKHEKVLKQQQKVKEKEAAAAAAAAAAKAAKEEDTLNAISVLEDGKIDPNECVPIAVSYRHSENTLSSSAVLTFSLSSICCRLSPARPRYCYCNQISYGEMVGCEGKSCAVCPVCISEENHAASETPTSTGANILFFLTLLCLCMFLLKSMNGSISNASASLRRLLGGGTVLIARRKQEKKSSGLRTIPFKSFRDAWTACIRSAALYT